MSDDIGATTDPTTPDSDAGEVVHIPLEPVVQAATPPATESGGSLSSGHACNWCGKICKSKGGLVRHQQSCKARPADIPPPVGRRAAAAASAPPLPPAKKLDQWTATEGAERAAAMVDAVSEDGGTVVDVMARMTAEEVGVPDLIALVCLRALPPPLSDEEYQALRMAYRDRGVQLPPWLMTLVVTLAVLGPRVAAHPVAGPWLREQLVGKRGKPKPKPQPKPSNVRPIVTPAPEPKPEQQTDETAREAVKRAMESMR